MKRSAILPPVAAFLLGISFSLVPRHEVRPEPDVVRAESGAAHIPSRIDLVSGTEPMAARYAEERTARVDTAAESLAAETPLVRSRPTPPPMEAITIRSADLNPSAGSELFDRIADAVVMIKGDRSHGTGFLITRDGLAITNHHVVDNQTSLVAHLRDNRELPVHVLRYDKDSDIALVRIGCEGACHTVPLGRTDTKVGREVYVIGNPFDLNYTLTRGIVSGFRARHGVTLVQTDAAINPGMSGGPIVDPVSGDVLAVVSWKMTGKGIEGLGFGVAIRDVLRVLGVRVDPMGSAPDTAVAVGG